MHKGKQLIQISIQEKVRCVQVLLVMQISIANCYRNKGQMSYKRQPLGVSKSTPIC